METCVSMSCPFMKNCKQYNFTVDRSGGCKTQGELLWAAKKYEEQKQLEEEKIKVTVLHFQVSSRKGAIVSRAYYLRSLNAAREFMRESYESWKTRTTPNNPINPQLWVSENRIKHKFAGATHLWEIAPAELLITQTEYRKRVSKITIYSPSNLHGWRLEYNYEPVFADAPAGEFLDAFWNEVSDDKDNWVLHQGGCEKKVGHKVLEYKGENGREVVQAVANKLAKQLDTAVDCR